MHYRSRVLSHYGLAVFSVAAALSLAFLVDNSVPAVFVFPFLAAIVVIARLTSKGPTLLASLLSTLTVMYFFLPPTNSFAIEGDSVLFFTCFTACALSLARLTMESDEQAEVRPRARRSGERRGV